MKKLILLLAAALLISCGASKKEVLEDPIFPQNKIIYGQQGKVGYVVEDPILSRKNGFSNYIVYEADGSKSYIVEDAIFPGNYLLFKEPE